MEQTTLPQQETSPKPLSNKAARNQEIVRLYVEENLSTIQIGGKLGLAAPSVRAVLLANDVQMRTQGRKGRSPWKDVFDEEQAAEVRRLLESGMPMAHVAAKMNVTPPTIQRWAKRMGVHQPRVVHDVPLGDVLKAFHAGEHVDLIAARYNITRPALYAITARANIDLRTLCNQRRAAARTPAAVREKRRYARELRRRKTDPVYNARCIAKSRRAKTYRRERYAPLLDQFFSQGCKTCGDKRRPGLDAHHRDSSSKSFCISARTNLRVSLEELQAELAKCDCYCAFCHRVLHDATDKQELLPYDQLSKTGKQMREARIRLKPIYEAFTAGGCQICGRKSHVGLSGHHYRPEEKSFNPARAPTWRKSNEEVIAELAKCTCLCETCHRLVHAGELICPVPCSFSQATVDSLQSSSVSYTDPHASPAATQSEQSGASL